MCQPRQAGPHGLLFRQRDGGSLRPEPWLWFPREGRAETGPAGLGLASLGDFRGLWGTGSP